MACVACGCASQPTKRLRTVGARYQAEPYTDRAAVWSHDGSRIAFYRVYADHRVQLMVADARLTSIHALLSPEDVSPDRTLQARTASDRAGNRPAWSPHDRRVAFQRVEWFTFPDGQKLPGTGLWAIVLSTGTVLPIALHPKSYHGSFYYYRSPAWSPDGRYFALVGEGIYGQSCIIIRPTGALSPEKADLVFDRYESSDWPVWRPGTGPDVLAYRMVRSAALAGSDRALINLLRPGSPRQAGSGIAWITPNTPPISSTGGGAAMRVGSIAWSPDGLHIAFTLTPDAADRAASSVWVVNLKSHKARRIAFKSAAAVWVGNRTVGYLRKEHGIGWELCVQNIKSGKAHVVGTVPNSDCQWSPSRSEVVYNTNVPQRGGTTLRVINTGLSRGAE